MMNERDHDRIDLIGLIDFVGYVTAMFGHVESNSNNPFGMPIWQWEDDQQEEAFTISLVDGIIGIWIESDDPKYFPVFDYAKKRGLNVKRKS